MEVQHRYAPVPKNAGDVETIVDRLGDICIYCFSTQIVQHLWNRVGMPHQKVLTTGGLLQQLVEQRLLIGGGVALGGQVEGPGQWADRQAGPSVSFSAWRN